MYQKQHFAYFSKQLLTKQSRPQIQSKFILWQLELLPNIFWMLFFIINVFQVSLLLKTYLPSGYIVIIESEESPEVMASLGK